LGTSERGIPVLAVIVVGVPVLLLGVIVGLLLDFRRMPMAAPKIIIKITIAITRTLEVVLQPSFLGSGVGLCANGSLVSLDPQFSQNLESSLFS
jgi:hypothetical protein